MDNNKDIINKNKHIGELLKNLSDALKIYSVEELNQAILTALNNKSSNKHIIDFVVGIVASEYKLKPNIILNSAKRKEVQDAKIICYAIFHFDLKFPIRFIAKNIFSKRGHVSVFIGLNKFKNLNPKYTFDKEVIDKYLSCKNRTLEYIINKNK